MNWRLFLRRHPRAFVFPFMSLMFLGLVSTLLRDGNVPASGVPRYLYQQVYQKYTNESTSYTITVVADKDKASKGEGAWESSLLTGTLSRDEETGRYAISWDKETITLNSQINEGGRGMELSDLTYFNGKLYTFDDRTGIVFEVDREKQRVIPQHILMDGNGRSGKGFKCEWGAVKDGLLYVGGLGKEWTNSEGKVLSRDPQYVKTIDTEGRIEHHSWVHVYEALREAAGTPNPGYLIHEAVRFNPVSRRWFFFPRRASKEAYDDVLDEKRGANIVISTNEDFEDIKVSRIGPQIDSHGFSSFSFVPYRENEVVALKTEELDGNIATYITVFDLAKEQVLLEESKIGDVKYEGVEFL